MKQSSGLKHSRAGGRHMRLRWIRARDYNPWPFLDVVYRTEQEPKKGNKRNIVLQK